MYMHTHTHTYTQTRASSRESHFLVNPYGLMFHEVTASSLVKVNLEGIIADPGGTQLGLNKDWFAVHSAIYAARPDVRCVAHVHTTSGAAVRLLYMCCLLELEAKSEMRGTPAGQQYMLCIKLGCLVLDLSLCNYCAINKVIMSVCS